MDTPLDIPGHEHFVSDVAVADGVLSLRLVSDIHPGIDSVAYTLCAHGIENPEEALMFLGRVKQEREYVYVYWSGDAVTVSTEGGNEVILKAGRFTGGAQSLNFEELSDALSRVYSWFEAESASNRAAQDRLNRVRELLTEQARRIEVKSQAHGPDGTAGVLYSQQLVFIHRALRETEI
jgi:hypothetical protein